MKAITYILLLAGAVMAPALGGCAGSVQSARSTRAMSGETYTLNPPQAVLDSPEIAAYRQKRRQWADQGLVSAEPWWTYRNDGRLNLRPGSNQSQVTDSLIYVHDRQYSSNGHIYNAYRRDAYSRSFSRYAD